MVILILAVIIFWSATPFAVNVLSYNFDFLAFGNIVRVQTVDDVDDGDDRDRGGDVGKC